ncbi:hypothetical protein NSA40_00805 [[Clostridium] innocuum]|nr:hypothetical protein [[Clostridium] innocuum]
MKPILFNTEMVQAILQGRKTVTRRIIKGLPQDAKRIGWLTDSGNDQSYSDGFTSSSTLDIASDDLPF